MQVFRERVPELELFSNFLRELYDYDVLLFFLHARQTVMAEQPSEVQVFWRCCLTSHVEAVCARVWSRGSVLELC